jgi:hypothetical protein
MFDGVEWKDNLRLTRAPLESKFPSAAVDGDGGIHLVWRDQRDSPTWNYEVYYKKGDPATLAGVRARVEDTSPGFIKITPNPVSAGATFRFSQKAKGAGSVAIYDVAGRLVWREPLECMPAGLRRVIWNGRDASGRRVAPGAYFVKVDIAGNRMSEKLILLK